MISHVRNRACGALEFSLHSQADLQTARSVNDKKNAQLRTLHLKLSDKATTVAAASASASSDAQKEGMARLRTMSDMSPKEVQDAFAAALQKEAEALRQTVLHGPQAHGATGVDAQPVDGALADAMLAADALKETLDGAQLPGAELAGAEPASAQLAGAELAGAELDDEPLGEATPKPDYGEAAD